MYSIAISLILIALLWPSGFNFLADADLGWQSLLTKSENILVNKSFPQRIKNNSLGIKTTAKSFIVFDNDYQISLLEKNSQLVLPIASLTKLMAVLIFLEHNPGWDKSVKINKEELKEGGIIYLRPDDEIKIKDLFYLTLIASANEGAMGLVKSTGLDLIDFIKLMNQKAQTLGMSNTIFFDPTGLEPRNISSVEDLIKLAQVAFSHSDIQKALLTKTYQFKILNSSRLVSAANTDKLLGSFLNDSRSGYQILGAKTGYLDEAKYSLVLSVKNSKNHNLIIVILGSETEKDRWQETKGLVDWVFNNYQWPEEVNSI